MKKYLLRGVTASMMIPLLFLCVQASAQYRQKLHTGINLTTGLSSKASIEGDGKTDYGLASAPQLLFEGTLNLYRELDEGYWLVTGLGGGVAAYNFDYYLPGDAFNPPAIYLFNNGAASRARDLIYLKVPLELERRWTTSRGNMWNANIGASLLFAPPMDVTSIGTVVHDGRIYEYMRVEQNNNNHGRPWFNYQLAGGYAWKLRWGHLLRVNLKLSLSFTDYGSATYRLSIPDKPVATGKYGVSGSYLGLTVGYLLKRAAPVE
ncbi:hypothetical protein [Chitinophaga alhagiae]|uniref:hypothetical protein n=1 Tax=Chitinophaga alhagiae TaxID=2203219 RepID=UPI000E5BB9D8|nr:hypothetical protein [Chitinophaga alhagiae]